MKKIDANALAALIGKASDEDLVADGRYFEGTCDDLTQCYHGDAGDFQNSGDGALVAFLWNHRREILILARDAEILKDVGLPAAFPLDSGPLRERAAKADL